MIRLSIRRPITVAMVYLAAALLGVAAWRNVPLELLPDTQLPQLHVSASWRGASPEAMEAFVTSPIEGAVQQVRGISKVTSVSEEQFGMGTARLTLAFVRGTDMDFARLELAERLSALERELPPGLVGPRVEQYVPEEFQRQRQPFLKYTVSGPYTLEALRAHVDRIIAPELLQVAGVADVDVQGGRDRVIEIELDDAKIGALGLDPETVRRRILELEYVQNAGVV
ncbi:MAG: efflux RND transporter permease subunit, partial [Gemmatimonadaceae bacterium]